jgi:hypothetical protein
MISFLSSTDVFASLPGSTISTIPTNRINHTYLYLLNDVVNYFTEENSENRLPQIPNIIKGFDENNSEKIEYKKANYY